MKNKLKKKARLAWERYHVRRFVNSLETRGVIDGNKAVLLVYNEEMPELTYIIVENL